MALANAPKHIRSRLRCGKEAFGRGGGGMEVWGCDFVNPVTRNAETHMASGTGGGRTRQTVSAVWFPNLSPWGLGQTYPAHVGMAMQPVIA